MSWLIKVIAKHPNNPNQGRNQDNPMQVKDLNVSREKSKPKLEKQEREWVRLWIIQWEN